MERPEGYANVIEVSREQFLAGPRRRTEKNAKITVLPTAAAERVPHLSDVLEQFVENGIISGIVEQLRIKNRIDEAIEIKIACHELLALEYGSTDIRDFVIEYTETIDPVLAEIAWTAIDVSNARLNIIDIEVFASERGKA